MGTLQLLRLPYATFVGLMVAVTSAITPTASLHALPPPESQGTTSPSNPATSQPEARLEAASLSQLADCISALRPWPAADEPDFAQRDWEAYRAVGQCLIRVAREDAEIAWAIVEDRDSRASVPSPKADQRTWSKAAILARLTSSLDPSCDRARLLLPARILAAGAPKENDHQEQPEFPLVLDGDATTARFAARRATNVMTQGPAVSALDEWRAWQKCGLRRSLGPSPLPPDRDMPGELIDLDIRLRLARTREFVTRR